MSELTHPFTGRPLRPGEAEIPEICGEVVRAVDDQKGRLILVYADGHLMVREREGSDIVWKSYQPEPTIQ